MKKVIFLLLDGARYDCLNKYLSLGYLPNLNKIIQNQGSNLSAISVFPSTTGPAYVPFLMGLYPGNANLPGIRWFDKIKFAQNKSNFEAHRSYVGVGSVFFNTDLKKSKSTIFEIIDESRSIFNEITRGIGSGCDITGMSKIYYKAKSHFTGSNTIDSVAMNKLFSLIDSKAEFIFCCLHGVDSNSHIYGFDHDVVIQSYKNFDLDLGIILSELERLNQLEDTLLIVTSDHGHSNTATHIDLVELLESQNLKVVSYPFIFNKYYQDVDAAVMVSGNSMAHIYLRNGPDWRQRYAFKKTDELFCNLLATDGIDLLMALNQRNQIVIKSNRGVALLEEKENLIQYQPLNDDPFGYPRMNEFLSCEEILSQTYDTQYPDALTQIVQLFKSNRCGDIIISADLGFDLRRQYEYPEHKSSHGSLHKDHMRVPLVVNKKVADKHIRTVDLFPTILDYLNKEIPNEVDGKKLDID